MPKNYVRPDERIYEDIWERLMRLSELELDEVTIDVAGGNVSVTGSVPDRFSRYVIEEVCAGTFGVHDVTIQLAIH